MGRETQERQRQLGDTRKEIVGRESRKTHGPPEGTQIGRD
jgi:hypothetical protein